MLLQGQGYVPLGYRYGSGVLALLVELADLRSQIDKLIATLRSRAHGVDGCQERYQPR
jgi:hypothetical protein